MAYTKYMPTTGEKTTITEDGIDKSVYTVAFTNGALQELEELQSKMELPDLESVVKLSIALLRRLKETENGPKTIK